MDRLVIGGETIILKKISPQWLILRPQNYIDKFKFSKIAELLYQKKIRGVKDVVRGVNDISLLVDDSFVIDQLSKLNFKISESKCSLYEVGVHFDKGKDWSFIEDHLNKPKKEIIRNICEHEYTFLMYGFLPGFIYLEGLPKFLSIPRRDKIRTLVPAGSLGIGGSQIGIYTMPSPGGWNLIGSSSHALFSPNNSQPLGLNVGDKIKFKTL